MQELSCLESVIAKKFMRKQLSAVVIFFLIAISSLFQYHLCLMQLTVLTMQAWLLALVILPARSNISMRFGLTMYLALLSILVLPKPVWMVSSFFRLI